MSLHTTEQAALLDQARDAIFVRDIDHTITYWNRSCERVFGWSRSDAHGRSALDLLSPDPESFAAAYDTTLEAGHWTGRIIKKRKDGKEVVVEGNWTLVRDEAGNPKAILSVDTDITEQVALEEQLRQSQRLDAIGKLTGGIAHDFNNLLTVILGNAETLTDRLGPENELHSMAKLINDAARKGASLTRSLLAFGRKQALQPRVVNANDLLANMSELLRSTLTETITIEFLPNSDIGNALVDPTHLESAILNLCLNARDAMPNGGKLIVETDNVRLDQEYALAHSEVLAGAYVMIAISDNGSGIASENLARVFEPFFTTKEPGKGSGLGLSQVFGFVKQSMGHIKIYSELGHGTTIKLYLPRSEAAVESKKPKPILSSQSQSGTILVVEDDDMVRDYVVRLVSSLGYTVLEAANGPDALVIAEANHINLLFTDVVMPGGMNGKHLADAVIKLKPEVKILYTSGYTEHAIVNNGLLDQGVQIINKPYRKLALARKLREILEDA